MNWDIITDNEITKQAATATLAHQNIICDIEISITFVDDGEMQELNNAHRGKNATTDVLSFSQYTADEIPNLNKKGNFALLGDIVISLDKAKAQAAEYGHSIERELAFLTVHSVLHLLGYDHDTAEAERVMFGLQKEVLSAMGLMR